MNTKFKRGPWGVGRSVKTMVFADEGLDLVADCTVGEFARDVEIANAALIASAPELYEALEHVENELFALVEALRIDGRLIGAMTKKEAADSLRAIEDRCAEVLKKARGEA